MTYGTDGGLSALDLQVLEDTRGVQPVYQPAPLVRADVLEAYPQIAELLEPIFAALDLQTLQRLNGEVAVEGADAARVAADFLDSLGD
ncbi:Glycine betaine-binding protein YehZ [compost metagenome]